jgi:hypothetical protein
MMLRLVLTAGLAAAFVIGPQALPQAFAATSQEKIETCTFGADEAKLTGAKRTAYMAKCTSNKDSPRGKATPSAAAPKAQ